MRIPLCLLGMLALGCSQPPDPSSSRGESAILPVAHPPLDGPASAPSTGGHHPSPSEWAWILSGGKSEQAADATSEENQSTPLLSSTGEDPTPLPVSLSEEGSFPLVPAPPGAVPVRGRKRMDIDQLNASIRAATGGIGWTQVAGGKTVDMWVQLSATLGKPDYLTSTQEDLSPSTLFEKFLGDAARSVCQDLMGREVEAPPEQRVFLLQVSATDTSTTNAAAVVENLRVLLLRWHGRSYAADATQLVPWQWLFDSTVHITGDPIAGWNAVCVGLMTHPDFYSY